MNIIFNTEYSVNP